MRPEPCAPALSPIPDDHNRMTTFLEHSHRHLLIDRLILSQQDVQWSRGGGPARRCGWHFGHLLGLRASKIASCSSADWTGFTR